MDVGLGRRGHRLRDYQPAAGEFGYGLDGVLTLPEFKDMVDESTGPLSLQWRPVRTVAYIYCVGSRQPEGRSNTYCSRYCCTAAVHASLKVGRPGAIAQVRQYHLYRDMRTYGKYELLSNRVARGRFALPPLPRRRAARRGEGRRRAA